MHFEILAEDQSGKKALDILVPKIVGPAHTFMVHSYKGIGRIPRDMRDTQDAGNRILLENLPKLLKGYGKTQAGRRNYQEAVILVCDLDDKCLKKFRAELRRILNSCHPRPEAHFCIAIEEGEAWLLGDIPAIHAAYPRTRHKILDTYKNDSICGTWEKLADAIYPGKASALATQGWHVVGTEKTKWAETICLHMTIDDNQSPSFCYFRETLRNLIR